MSPGGMGRRQSAVFFESKLTNVNDENHSEPEVDLDNFEYVQTIRVANRLLGLLDLLL